jgi:5'-nucleotidase
MTPAVLAVAVVLGGGSWAPGRSGRDAPQAPTVTLSIVGTTDLHGRIHGDGGRGGLALFGGYLAALRAARAADGGGVVLLDAGDTFQGGLDSNLSEGAVVIDAYNALGYTALAIGNHDFEYGAVDQWDPAPSAPGDLRGALKARAAQARFPFLAANLVEGPSGAAVAWPNVLPSALVEVAGLRVGIIGAMTEPALSMTLAANVRDLAVTPLAPAIDREARRLRNAGAAVVAVVAHAGGSCESFADPDDLRSCHGGAEMFQVIRALPADRIDAVVAGHTHAAVAHRVHGVPVVQAYSWGGWFSRVDLTVDLGAGRVAASRVFPPQEICARVDGAGRCTTSNDPAGAPAHYEGRVVAPDARVTAAMTPALERVRALRATPLGVSLDAPLARAASSGESALGNLFAEALRAAVPGANVAITFGNGPGGLRADLDAGPLRLGDVYDAFPFDNRVARIATTADGLRRLIRDRVRRPRWRGRAFGVSGLHVSLTCGPAGVDVALASPTGARLAPDERLVVATTDFLASWVGGGPPPEPLANAAVTALQLRDAVVHFVRAQRPTLRAGRFASAAAPRWSAVAVEACPAQ